MFCGRPTRQAGFGEVEGVGGDTLLVQNLNNDCPREGSEVGGRYEDVGWEGLEVEDNVDESEGVFAGGIILKLVKDLLEGNCKDSSRLFPSFAKIRAPSSGRGQAGKWCRVEVDLKTHELNEIFDASVLTLEGRHRLEAGCYAVDVV